MVTYDWSSQAHVPWKDRAIPPLFQYCYQLKASDGLDITRGMGRSRNTQALCKEANENLDSFCRRVLIQGRRNPDSDKEKHLNNILGAIISFKLTKSDSFEKFEEELEHIETFVIPRMQYAVDVFNPVGQELGRFSWVCDCVKACRAIVDEHKNTVTKHGEELLRVSVVDDTKIKQLQQKNQELEERVKVLEVQIQATSHDRSVIASIIQALGLGILFGGVVCLIQVALIKNMALIASVK